MNLEKILKKVLIFKKIWCKMTSKWRKVVKSGEMEKEVRKLANWRI